MAYPRGARMLKGVSTENIVDDATAHTVEVECSEDELTEAKPVKRSLRASGNKDVNYDMKFHPMDAVTRPNSSATLRHRSKSVSFADELDDDEDESEPSPPRDDDREDEESDEESEEESTTSPLTHRIAPTPRTPDPRAVRHSGRSLKPVNYSKKYHPQDYALPGYQHKALSGSPPVQSSQKPKKRAARRQEVVSDDADDEVAVEPRRPRKKLKSLDPNVGSSPKQIAKKQALSKESDSPAKLPGWSDDIDNLVAFAIEASQPPRKLTTQAVNEISSATMGHDEVDQEDFDIDNLVESAIEASRAPVQWRNNTSSITFGREEADKEDLEPASVEQHHSSEFEEQLAITERRQSNEQLPDYDPLWFISKRSGDNNDDSDVPPTEIFSQPSQSL